MRRVIYIIAFFSFALVIYSCSKNEKRLDYQLPDKVEHAEPGKVDMEIISEASRRLPQELKDREQEIPWKAIGESGNGKRESGVGHASLLVFGDGGDGNRQSRIVELL